MMDLGKYFTWQILLLGYKILFTVLQRGRYPCVQYRCISLRQSRIFRHGELTDWKLIIISAQLVFTPSRDIWCLLKFLQITFRKELVHDEDKDGRSCSNTRYNIDKTLWTHKDDILWWHTDPSHIICSCLPASVSYILCPVTLSAKIWGSLLRERDYHLVVKLTRYQMTSSSVSSYCSQGDWSLTQPAPVQCNNLAMAITCVMCTVLSRKW